MYIIQYIIFYDKYIRIFQIPFTDNLLYCYKLPANNIVTCDYVQYLKRCHQNICPRIYPYPTAVEP